MVSRSATLEATLDELRTAGYSPTWEQGRKHIKIHVEGLPPITVSGTSSDANAAKVARRAVRKIMAQNQLTPQR